ncbi:hypothetical protein, partial [Craterilacuibacter sp.]|uniref:hypothetical protein n=1 Tax=Craterilacuibacter sp. TaxID=2870909 RepID=UPI003F3187CF
ATDNLSSIGNILFLADQGIELNGTKSVGNNAGQTDYCGNMITTNASNSASGKFTANAGIRVIGSMVMLNTAAAGFKGTMKLELIKQDDANSTILTKPQITKSIKIAPARYL